MANISVYTDDITGRIKPMHGVGQPPFSSMNFSMFHYLTEAGIPFSRLHDTGGMYGLGRFVDIPNVFPDFNADENDPASYDFAFTDRLITELVNAGVEPFYRLGVTIENYCAVRMYRLAPPSDFDKWARICEGVIRHYTQGWADGYRYPIRYWEIWNEPDNSPTIPENQMWWGTEEQYFELYDVTAKHLKKVFPDLRIGGYASCGFYGAADMNSPAAGACSPRNRYFLDFFDDFLKYIKAHGSPMDFFSWHSYASIKDTVFFAGYARKKLDEAGYVDVEHMCNEWNCEPEARGTFKHAALTAGWMLAMQDTTLDEAMFYDARFGVSVYGGMFDPSNAKPYPAYYAFKEFNELYKLGNEMRTCAEDGKDVYAAAAGDGKKGSLLIANASEEEQPLNVCINGGIVTGCRITGDGKVCCEAELPDRLPAWSFILIGFETK